MRAKGIRFEQVLMAGMLLAALCWNLAQASEIRQLRVDTGPTGTRAEVLLDRAGDYRLIELQGPDRLVVDFPQGTLGRGLAVPAAAGAVKAVRTGQPTPGMVRIVFDLSSRVKAMPPRIEASPAGPRLVLEWPGDHGVALQTPAVDPVAAVVTTPALQAAQAPEKFVGKAATVSPLPGVVATGVPTRIASGKPATVGSAATPATPVRPVPQPRNVPPAVMRTLVVAIDAGHGGQDPGAIGLNGSREKDITLAIARELARQVNATPGLRAFLTRDADRFIPLGQRARNASAAKADIFLSIHADAAENRNARGSSVYVLSTRGASSQRARWLADKENAADVIGGERVRGADDTLATVLLDLTQSGNMKASADAAGHVLGGLRQVGRNHKPQVEHANFAVLRTSDRMPAMLVETAFLSNPEEERRLVDPAYQRQLATAILAGIDRYFAAQPPPGTLYAARALERQQAMAAAGGTGGSP